MLMTTVALVRAMGLRCYWRLPAIRVYGMVTSVSIASALVGDLLILPAILVSLGWSRDSSALT